MSPDTSVSTVYRKRDGTRREGRFLEAKETGNQREIGQNLNNADRTADRLLCVCMPCVCARTNGVQACALIYYYLLHIPATCHLQEYRYTRKHVTRVSDRRTDIVVQTCDSVSTPATATVGSQQVP
jgi:hypothetical protein